MIEDMDVKKVSPSLDPDDKQSRGFYHYQTARLLFPMTYLHEFDDDKDV